MIDHNISLIVKDDLDKTALRSWYNSVKNHAPNGVVKTAFSDGKTASMVKSKRDKSVRYAVPLTRDLQDGEVQKIVEAFAATTDLDFEVYATSSSENYAPVDTIEIEHEPLLQLCTKWAKQKHDNWMAEKIGNGWRYGPTVSQSNKTHPLLRAWDELPAEYRKVDIEQPQELLDMLHASGYVMIAKDELDRMMGSRR